MSQRASKQRRLEAQQDVSEGDPCRPATESEKRDWNGFCEIESEPALFNVMLREFGVKGVKVQEVVSLDDEMLAFLNKPIYGLIFLFRWREDDPEKQEASCPEGLWFANQTASNACASVALLNIVNNIEGIDLGENLQHFKDFTMPFTPALRGDAINNFEFVKRVHNSFARKMDIFNSDLQLKNEATSSKRSKSKKNNHDDYTSDAGFHFIAFVPTMGRIWKFDGLERQPQDLGPCPEDNWLDGVKANIIDRMAEYEEGQIEFSILSLAKDPLLDLIGELAANVRCLEIVNERIASQAVNGSESAFADFNHGNTVLGPDPSYDLTRERIDSTPIPDDQVQEYQSCPVDKLVEHQKKLKDLQQTLRASIKEEQQSHRADDDYAIGRRYDYGPAVRTWLRLLARKRMIENLSEDLF